VQRQPDPPLRTSAADETGADEKHWCCPRCLRIAAALNGAASASRGLERLEDADEQGDDEDALMRDPGVPQSMIRISRRG